MKVTATLMLLLLLGWTLAIQGEPDGMEGEKTDPPPVLQPGSKPDPKERSIPSPRIFNPSEKISADSAVSFPVDI